MQLVGTGTFQPFHVLLSFMETRPDSLKKKEGNFFLFFFIRVDIRSKLAGVRCLCAIS